MSADMIGYMPMPPGFKYRDVFLHGRPKHERFDSFRRKHPPMDTVHRAKIFAPFDALAGFDAAIDSKLVLYEERRILSETEKEDLDRKLSLLRSLTYNSPAARKNKPEVTVEYFSPCTDPCSEWYGKGGTYKTLSGICWKVDIILKTITVDDHVIPLKNISKINTGRLSVYR